MGLPSDSRAPYDALSNRQGYETKITSAMPVER